MCIRDRTLTVQCPEEVHNGSSIRHNICTLVPIVHTGNFCNYYYVTPGFATIPGENHGGFMYPYGSVPHMFIYLKLANYCAIFQHKRWASERYRIVYKVCIHQFGC